MVEVVNRNGDVDRKRIQCIWMCLEIVAGVWDMLRVDKPDVLVLKSVYESFFGAHGTHLGQFNEYQYSGEVCCLPGIGV